MLKDKAVTIRHLRKNYPGGFALDIDGLHVDRGEVFALLGPNGAGKTTLTEILSGLRDRDGGELDVLGGDPGKAGNAWRARVGVVLQDSHDYARLTVQEVLSHFAGFYPGARDPRELAEAVGLGPQWNRRAAQLSGGQRRRLDVALGLIGGPELLFLDEPTTGFDPEVRAQFWELIAALGEEGTTIVLTTHYLDEVERLANRVAVLSKGRIADVDTPSRLGGRHLAKAVVGWRDPEGHHWVESANPTATVAELAGRYDGDIPMLTVRHPSLEDVYLKMIGESA